MNFKLEIQLILLLFLCFTQTHSACGDGAFDLSDSQACDDGNVDPGDGCSATCKVEDGFLCWSIWNDGRCSALECGDSNTDLSSLCDGKTDRGGFICYLSVGETCDDGNADPGDGCSAACTVEDGYTCTNPFTWGTPSICSALCGDSTMQTATDCDGETFADDYSFCYLSADETCDDSNADSSDGCSTTCTVEDGYECTDTTQGPSTCSLIPPLDCETDSGSTGTLLEKIGECECKIQFSWDNESQKCLPNCLTPLSIGPNPDDKTQCLCKFPAVWDDNLKDCYLQCKDVTFSTGQHLSSTVCDCEKVAYWKESEMACALNCSSVLGAEGLASDSMSCICKTTYIWSAEERICKKDCESDELWNQQYNSDGSCGCVQGALWDYAAEKCYSLDCSSFQYATGEQTDDAGCVCQTNFVWDSRLHQCIIQCQAFKDAGDTLATGDDLSSQTCACVATATWDEQILKCIRTCSEIPFSTGINSNLEDCHCINGYTWNSVDVSCQISCGGRVGQLAEYNQAERHCTCDAEFYWSPVKSACYRDCYLESFAYPQDGPDADSCNCFTKYEWDSDAKNCVLSCDGAFDVAVNDAGTACDCQDNSYFSRNTKSCLVDCTKDKLSTRVFLSNKCECKANSMWNSENNACECVFGYVFVEASEYCERQGASGSAIAMGVVGGSLLSGPLVFAGLKLSQRRKKEQENKKTVEIEGAVAEQPQSGKNINSVQI